MDKFNEASLQTNNDLLEVASTHQIRKLSHLTLPEIEAVVNLVAQRIPAGNIPAMILGGLAHLSTRKTPIEKVRNDINALFNGVEHMLDKAVFAAFFAGPAAVIWGYQQLLQLAGKNPDDAFPEGTWQFYADYALREDTARHASETQGFDTYLQTHNIRQNEIDRITAWVMTAIHTIHQYPALLKNEWRERVYLTLLNEVIQDQPNAAQYAGLYREWERKRPYARPLSYKGTLAEYRHQAFNDFLDQKTGTLPTELTEAWRKKIRLAQAILLPHYQKQMSILAYLEPDIHGETRTPLAIEKLHVGVIYKGHYYLIPVCKPTTKLPNSVSLVRAKVAAFVTSPSDKPPVNLTELVRVRRSHLPQLKRELSRQLVQELETLQRTPILINATPRSRQLPLMEIRQTERGIGDHALTIFDTGKTFVFDQSHIFFDGAWGASLAEMMTNEAIHWLQEITKSSPVKPAEKRPYRPRLVITDDDQKLIATAPHITAEATAESEVINLEAIRKLRKLLKQRNELIDLTVNDLLILYRAIHAAKYEPSPFVLEELDKLGKVYPEVAQQTRMAITTDKPIDPAILIPIDGSLRSPRDRVYPISFTVPLADLDLLKLHQKSLDALAAYEKKTKGDRSKAYARFDDVQRRYLATLAGYGAIIRRMKSIAGSEQGVSTNIAKLLAFMPPSIQKLLNAIPDSFDVLNDLIKGREVFSNIGAVVDGSSLTRFMTAKDDNEKKTLAWGVITDTEGIMRISLRDFRPHVSALDAIGHHSLATLITQDYLDTYGHGMNAYVRQLRDITEASRETNLKSPVAK